MHEGFGRAIPPGGLTRSEMIELRRWCVEQALRWPNYMAQQYQAVPSPPIMGYAQQIFDFVTAPPAASKEERDG